MNRKITSSLVLLITCISFAHAVNVSDPNDSIYNYLQIWEEKGYTNKLPPLRPYPAQLIIRLLQDVSENASDSDYDRQKAEKYLEELESFSISASAIHNSRFSVSDYYGESGVNAKIEGFLSPEISISGDINLLIVDRQASEALPAYTSSTRDLLPDWSDVDIFGKNYLVRQGINSSAAVGTDSMYFQTGLIRSSFGPFYDDGAVLSPKAPQSGHFSFNWLHNSFTFTSALLSLTATNGTGEGRYPEKFLSIHSIYFYPLEWIEFGVFETVVYGDRFEPLYLIPFSEFFYLQGVLGFPDNSLLGFSTSVDLPYNIDFDFLLYADDLHFNDMIRLDFDTKYKLSFQTGISWTPEIEKINRLSLDYLLVTPYMYTHNPDNAESINYQNYTNMGVNMGPTLEPNSDRVTLSFTIQPVDILKLEIIGKFIRHANGSVDGSVNVGGGDGTIFDDGFLGSICTFQETTRFMVQDIIEYTLQTGLNADLNLSLDPLKITAAGGYTIERVENKDLFPGTEWNHYFKIGLGITY